MGPLIPHRTFNFVSEVLKVFLDPTHFCASAIPGTDIAFVNLDVNVKCPLEKPCNDIGLIQGVAVGVQHPRRCS